MKNPREHVELFHLLFLDQLSRNLDNKLYAVKGGCNLRFFFKSIRYSEDLDLDVHTIAPQTLENKINRLLSGAPLQHILQAQGIQVARVTSPKQTATTQRWKILLDVGSSLPIHTKIECSCRGMEEQVRYDAVDVSIIHRYHLSPIICSHYDAQTAYVQKILALAGRPQTQARDIFDLFFLQNSQPISLTSVQLSKTPLLKAQEQALAVSFQAFKSQVVSYLPLDFQAQYNSAELWNTMVERVVDQIGQINA